MQKAIEIICLLPGCTVEVFHFNRFAGQLRVLWTFRVFCSLTWRYKEITMRKVLYLGHPLIQLLEVEHICRYDGGLTDPVPSTSANSRPASGLLTVLARHSPPAAKDSHETHTGPRDTNAPQ